MQVTKQIYIEVYDPQLGAMEDDAWVEVTFDVPLTFSPEERSVGFRGGWFVDGFIRDEVGYEFVEEEIDDMYILVNGDEYDWDSLFNEARQDAQDRVDDDKIEAYEASKEFS